MSECLIHKVILLFQNVINTEIFKLLEYKKVKETMVLLRFAMEKIKFC